MVHRPLHAIAVFPFVVSVLYCAILKLFIIVQYNQNGRQETCNGENCIVCSC